MKAFVFLSILSLSQPLWANAEAAAEAVAARMLAEQLQEDGAPEPGVQGAKGLTLKAIKNNQIPAIELRISAAKLLKNDDFTYPDLLKFGQFFARDWNNLMWYEKGEKVGDLQVESFASTLKMDTGDSLGLSLVRYRSEKKANANMTRSAKTLNFQDTYIKMLIQRLPSGTDPVTRKQWEDVRSVLFSPNIYGRYNFLKDYFTEKNAGRVVSGRMLVHAFDGIRYFGEEERKKIEASRQAAESLASAIRKVRESALLLTQQCTGAVCRLENVEFDISGNEVNVTETDPVRALTLMARRYITGDRYLFDRSRGLLESLESEIGLKIHNPKMMERLTFSRKRAQFEKELTKLIDGLREVYQQVQALQSKEGIHLGFSQGHTFFADEAIRRSLESEEFGEELTAELRRILSKRYNDLPLNVVRLSLNNVGSCLLLFNK